MAHQTRRLQKPLRQAAWPRGRSGTTARRRFRGPEGGAALTRDVEKDAVSAGRDCGLYGHGDFGETSPFKESSGWPLDAGRKRVASSQQLSAERSGAIRVLIVDDDSVLVRALQRVLALQGFDVDAALDGRSA